MMKNLRELFTIYPFGFDTFGAWLDHHREMHRRHPLDVPEFGAEWLQKWEALGKLLNTQVRVGCKSGSDPTQWIECRLNWTFAQALLWLHERQIVGPHRITLLDGTIVKEWPEQ